MTEDNSVLSFNPIIPYVTFAANMFTIVDMSRMEDICDQYWTPRRYQLGSPLVDDRPIMSAVNYKVVSGVVWTNRTMVSSNTDTNITGVLAVVDIAVSPLALQQGEPGSFPGLVTGFLQVGIVPDDAFGQRVFSGISRFPRHFIPALLNAHLNHPHRLSRPCCLLKNETYQVEDGKLGQLTSSASGWRISDVMLGLTTPACSVRSAHGEWAGLRSASLHLIGELTPLLLRWGWEVLSCASYTPDLSSCDYDLIPKVKRALRHRRFANMQAFQREVLHTDGSHAAGGISRLPHRWQRTVDNLGDYFEVCHWQFTVKLGGTVSPDIAGIASLAPRSLMVKRRENLNRKVHCCSKEGVPYLATSPGIEHYSGATSPGIEHYSGATSPGIEHYSGATSPGIEHYSGATSPGIEHYSGATSPGIEHYSGATSPGIEHYSGATSPGIEHYSGATSPGIEHYSGATSPGIEHYSGATSPGIEHYSGATSPGIEHYSGATSPGIEHYSRATSPGIEHYSGATSPEIEHYWGATSQGIEHYSPRWELSADDSPLFVTSDLGREVAKHYRNSIQLERASEKQSSDTHKTPYDRVKRCRERKINIKASERVNVDVFTQNKRPYEAQLPSLSEARAHQPTLSQAKCKQLKPAHDKDGDRSTRELRLACTVVGDPLDVNRCERWSRCGCVLADCRRGGSRGCTTHPLRLATELCQEEGRTFILSSAIPVRTGSHRLARLTDGPMAMRRRRRRPLEALQPAPNLTTTCDVTRRGGVGPARRSAAHCPAIAMRPASRPPLPPFLLPYFYPPLMAGGRRSGRAS
ncbi:hypothetical protein PR048_025864 [Dryococelus australis]|uniref:Uncharacterized protein n=1 Tax=Dryococelus australis TaxID=614101 RepID=A0ABQ9GJS6_9NEOP|nr:hypothetical protein PR048_025864 [Dryococelus australis]